jgi:quercetin dioxygenase-like cupin family protein
LIDLALDNSAASVIVSATDTDMEVHVIRLARVLLGAVVMVSLSTVPRTVRAQDVAAVNPGNMKVTLDNQQVRVMEATLKPGVKERMHSHPSSIVYVLTGGKVRSHTPDGKVSDATYTAGQTLYREPLTHWAENVGTTTIHLLVIELKNR